MIGTDTFWKRKWFSILVNTIRLFDKAFCALTAKQHICWFLGLNKKILNVEAHFARNLFVTAFILLLAYMDIDTLLSWKIFPGKIDITKNILNWFLCFFKNKNVLVTEQEKGICLFFRRTILDLIGGIALKNFSRFCPEILKTFCACKMYPKTLYWENTLSQ